MSDHVSNHPLSGRLKPKTEYRIYRIRKSDVPVRLLLAQVVSLFRTAGDEGRERGIFRPLLTITDSSALCFITQGRLEYINTRKTLLIQSLPNMCNSTPLLISLNIAT